MKILPLIIILLLINVTALPQSRRAFWAGKDDNRRVFKENTILIFKGEKLILGSGHDSGRLKSLVLDQKLKSNITDFKNMSNTVAIHNADKALSLDFDWIYPEDSNTMSVLLFKNPYKKRLIYKIRIFSEQKNRYVKVKVQPIIPGLTSIVTWPEPVSSLIIYKIRVAEDD